jgi:hypothetical protein
MILTKEEYREKINNSVVPVIKFAMTTEQFHNDGCYTEEFVKVGENEVTLIVADKNWVVLKLNEYYDLLECRNKCWDLERKIEQLKEEYEYRIRNKKFLGIF